MNTTQEKFSGDKPKVYLNTMENLFHIAHNKLSGALTPVAILSMRGVVQEDYLKRTLVALQRRHPLLRAAIREDEKQKPYFYVYDQASSPHIPVEVKGLSDKAVLWEKEIIESYTVMFAVDTGPLCKVKLLLSEKEDKSKLIIAFHHSIVDGQSVATIFQELLQEYQIIEASGKEEAAIQERERALPAALPLIYPKIPTQRLKLSDKVKGMLEFLRSILRPPVSFMETDSNDSVIFFKETLSSADTKALENFCKEKSISLHGVLSAAALLSIKRIVKKSRVRLSCNYPVSFRKFITPPVGDEHLGYFVGALINAYQLGEDVSFEKIAKLSDENFLSFIYSDGPIKNVQMAEQVFHPKALPPKPFNTVAISSYGFADFESDYDSLQLEEIDFRANIHGIAASYFAVTSVAIRGRLNISLTTKFLYQSTAERWVEDFKAILREVIAKNKI